MRAGRGTSLSCGAGLLAARCARGADHPATHQSCAPSAPLVAANWFQFGKAPRPRRPRLARGRPARLDPGPGGYPRGRAASLTPGRQRDRRPAHRRPESEVNDGFTPQETKLRLRGDRPTTAPPAAPFPTSPVAQAMGAEGETTDSGGHDVKRHHRRRPAPEPVILKGTPARVPRSSADRPAGHAGHQRGAETVFVELPRPVRATSASTSTRQHQIATAATCSPTGFPSLADTPSAVGQRQSAGGALRQIPRRGRIVSKPRIAARAAGRPRSSPATPCHPHSIALSGVNAVQQQVQYVNVGVTLQIAPRVTRRRHGHLHVLQWSPRSPASRKATRPSVNAEASTAPPSGRRFVRDRRAEPGKRAIAPQQGSRRGRPARPERSLRSGNSSRTQTDLYIVVTPHIVRGADAAASRRGADPGRP